MGSVSPPLSRVVWGPSQLLPVSLNMFELGGRLQPLQ